MSLQAAPPAVMKQQGFHVSEGAHWAAKPSDAHLSSSQASASSKLADGLQGLMDMCNAGTLTSVSPDSSVGLLPRAQTASISSTLHAGSSVAALCLKNCHCFGRVQDLRS